MSDDIKIPSGMPAGYEVTSFIVHNWKDGEMISPPLVWVTKDDVTFNWPDIGRYLEAEHPLSDSVYVTLRIAHAAYLAGLEE